MAKGEIFCVFENLNVLLFSMSHSLFLSLENRRNQGTEHFNDLIESRLQTKGLIKSTSGSHWSKHKGSRSAFRRAQYRAAASFVPLCFSRPV